MSEAVVRKVIKTIPATRDRYTATPIKAETKRRVAAYARVSTDDEEQQTSYEHQVTHYTQYIQEHEGWLFAGMFTDMKTPSLIQFNDLRRLAGRGVS